MMQYDRKYLGKVEEEGIKMRMYARYVDDSNQIVESDERDEETVAMRLKEIANNIIDGIEMEEDLPCRPLSLFAQPKEYNQISDGTTVQPYNCCMVVEWLCK